MNSISLELWLDQWPPSGAAAFCPHPDALIKDAAVWKTRADGSFWSFQSLKLLLAQQQTFLYDLSEIA